MLAKQVNECRGHLSDQHVHPLLPDEDRGIDSASLDHETRD